MSEYFNLRQMELYSQIALSIVFIVGIVTLVVAITKYLFSARVKNFATASDVGIHDKDKKAEIEQNLYVLLGNKLRKIGTPFIAKYESVGRIHRILYMTGVIAALTAIILLGVLAIFETITAAVPTLSANLVLSFSHGIKYAFNDLIGNLLVIIFMSASFTIIFGAIQYLGTRYLCVYRIQKGKPPHEEPEAVDKEDLTIISIGIIAPISVIIVVLLMFYYKGIHESYRDNIAEIYPTILITQVIKTVSSDSPYPTRWWEEKREIEIEDRDKLRKVMSEKFRDLLKLSDAKKSLIIGSLTDHFLTQDTTKNISADDEARKVSLALKLVDQSLASEILSREYYKFYHKFEKLMIYFNNRQRGSEFLGLNY